MKKMASDSIEKEHECEDFVIDIPLALEPALWPECCIYKIPKKLYEVNKEAYIPKLVSIGPFHHRREELRNMEIEKLRYLREFCYRTRKNHEDLRKIIKENEVKIRHCYSEECRVLNSKDFVKMILLDAIFIIELFWRNKYDENDYIANKPWLANGIRYDLILLENQLPFFVLEKLYTFTFTDSTTTFLELSLDYFPYYGIQQPKFDIGEVKHFTDLIRYLICLAPDLKPTGYLDNLYCATKLDMAGLKFKAVEDHRRLLEIKLPENRCLKLFPCFDLSCFLACLPCFKCFPCLERMQCILEVPPFGIDENTETLFRNLMALEQCHYPFNAYICNYILLLDYLIDTEKDVDLLVDKKIIINQLGSNATVATLINRLGYQIVEDKSCYYDLGQELNKHYDYPLNHILATLTSLYFRDFWRGTASVVGLIVLGFTFWSFLRPFAI